MTMRSGGNILIESLRAHGVKHIFCVPGESYLDALDALHDANDIRTVTCRQEGGAAFMAEAYAKLTGNTGICFVTRGPGATNASIGVHTAKQDSTPMILLVGQVARDQKGREAFQEIEYADMFKPPITKGVFEIMETCDIPQIMQQAFALATSGRPGPVVVSLPEDMLSDESDAQVLYPDAKLPLTPTKNALAEMEKVLNAAERPVVIIGGGGWHDVAIRQVEYFCQQNNLPVITGFRRQDAFDNTHPCYAGVLGTTVDAELTKAVEDADVILAIGTRLGEILTQGYTLITPGQPKQKIIHVYPDIAEINKVYTATVGIHASVSDFAENLETITINGDKWKARTEALHARYKAWSGIASRNKFTPDMDGIFEDLLSVLPRDAVITTDAGNFSGWAQRYIRYKRPTRLLAPTSGAMGYGVPAAVAASIAAPGRIVVGMMGDGGFMMTGQEIATAIQAKATPIFLVFNNSMYGTIRMHQEKHYPHRISATNLVNPDFAALARSYGAEGFTVSSNDEFLPAFQAAVNSGKPALIEIRMDPQQITTGKKLSELS